MTHSKNVNPPIIYPPENCSKACREIRLTYDSRANSFDSCKKSYTHVNSEKNIFQNRNPDEQFTPWNMNPRKHINHTNWEAKTPGSTDLEWLQYAKPFSNITMIVLLIIMRHKIRQLQLFETEILFIKSLSCKVRFKSKQLEDNKPHNGD